MGRIITLTSDFGLQDNFIGVMKGVMLGISDDLRFVDITHAIPAQSVAIASLVLDKSWHYFPHDTTHLIVVDPGVGTDRRVLACSYGGQFFVAPDNGILTPILREAAVRSVEEKLFFLPKRSSTFHGRDIFAPIAAHISNGVSLQDLGPVIDDYVLLDQAPPLAADDKIFGEVVYIDHFGNLISNISSETLRKVPGDTMVKVALDQHPIGAIRQTYAETKPGKPLALINSMDLLEIAVNQGSAREYFGVDLGAPVTVSR